MTYTLVTDGTALAYANCGGWAFILNEKARSGTRHGMGSNKMELWAILEGLSSIAQSSTVTVYTDSWYVINGVKKRKYRDQELWAELYLWLQVHNVTFVKVGKGRPHIQHTRAHHLAREAVFDEVRTRGNATTRTPARHIQAA